jgi:hypothetical protein
MWRSYLTIERSDDLRSGHPRSCGLSAYARRPTILSGGPLRCREDGPELLGLGEELIPDRPVTQAQDLYHLQPVNGLVGFLDDNSQFGDTLRAGPRA